ncbi:MAG: YidB family protein [Steroidobacteraceae bacterium]
MIRARCGALARPCLGAYLRRVVREESSMGLFDGVIGGLVGAEMATVINGLIERHGGVQGVIMQLEQQGLGGTVRSWVGTSANQPISAQQVHEAFGADTIAQLAAKAGLTPQELLQKLAQTLPQAIDKLTPTGVVPNK